MYLLDREVGLRAFIKGGSAVAVVAAAGTALTGCASTGSAEHALGTNVAGISRWGREAGEWIPSCCNMCGGQCGILVQVIDGKVNKIEPNNWNPNNYTNISSDFFDGYTETYGVKDGAVICAKGNAGIAQLYDPDRVTKPLKRMNPDKSMGTDPMWQEISWSQALDEIAAKMKTLRDANEAHKLLWISEDHSFTHVQVDFNAYMAIEHSTTRTYVMFRAKHHSRRWATSDRWPISSSRSTSCCLVGTRLQQLNGFTFRIITRAIEMALDS